MHCTFINTSPFLFWSFFSSVYNWYDRQLVVTDYIEVVNTFMCGSNLNGTHFSSIG